MQKLRTERGITLIALIITVIVMLILVGVTVSISLNGGLFNTAQDAVDRTKAERDNELVLSSKDIIEQYLPEKQGITIVPATYNIGDRVKIGNEYFYVIGGDEVGTEINDSTQKVILLVEYNIKAEGTNLIQDTTAGPCAVSTDSTLEFIDEEDLNDKLKDDETSAVYKAIKYGEKFKTEGVTGRLMTHGEAELLSESEDEDIIKILYGTYSDEQHLSYWLGTADDGYFVWAVYYDSGFIGIHGQVESRNFDEIDYIFGVRPILEISKSAIK